MIYREQWVKIQFSLPTYMDNDLEYIKKHWGPCDERWNQYHETYKKAVQRGEILRRLEDPNAFLASVMAINLTAHGCPGCTEYWSERQGRLRRQVAAVRAFSTL